MTIAAYDASGKNLIGVCINVITNSSQTQLEEESEECQQEPEVCSVTEHIALEQIPLLRVSSGFFCNTTNGATGGARRLSFSLEFWVFPLSFEWFP